MQKISPLAFVDTNAKLADDVVVGPFCMVGPDVTLGAGCQLLSHVVVTGHTTLGSNNVLHPNSVVGGPPQDLKYRGGKTSVIIGDNNVIREGVTINAGTEVGGGITRVGSGNLIMINAHIGHDAQFGDRNIIANNVMIAGHVVFGSNVVILGGAGVHHFVTIGDFAYIAGAARIHHDVPPYVKVSDADQIRAINAEGLRRAGIPVEDIDALDEAGRRLFFKRERPLATVMEEFSTQNGLNPYVRTLIDFLRRRDSGKFGRYLEGQRKRESYIRPTE